MNLSHLLAAFFTIGISSAFSQALDVRRHIEVDATSRVSADVDRAGWQIKMRGEAASLAEASKKLDASAESLKERLKTAGLSPESLRFIGIASGKFYENNRDTKTFKGFFAERAAVVELPDLSKRQSLETVLLADDQIEIVKVDLRASKHEELRKQALLAAVNAAREKAGFLAKEAGSEIGAVLSIREGNTNSGWGGAVTANNIMETVFAQDNTAEFEKLEYSATVTVKFELK